MKKCGVTFRKFRIEKGYRIAEVAAGICTPQFLAKFERNESDISVTLLTKLLNRILVSWREFMLEHNEDTIDQVVPFSQKIEKLLFERDYFAIEQQMNDYNQRYKETNNPIDLHLSLLAKAEVSTQGQLGIFFTQKDVSTIKNYLMGIEKWCEYENFLFYHFIDKLAVTDVKVMYKRVTRNILRGDYLINPIDVIVKLISYFIHNHLLEDAQEVIDYSEKHLKQLTNPRNIYERCQLRYKKGLILLLRGDIDEGETIILQCIEFLRYIDDYKLETNEMYKELRSAKVQIENELKPKFPTKKSS